MTQLQYHECAKQTILNKQHPTITFYCKISKKEIAFPDTKIYIELFQANNGICGSNSISKNNVESYLKLTTKLYTKRW